MAEQDLDANRVEQGANSNRVGLGPVDAAASFALGEAIVAREDIRRYAPEDEFARDRHQEMIALRASRERDRVRVEAKSDDDFAELIAKRVALDEDDVGCGAQALVAGDENSAFTAGDFQEIGAGERCVGEDVDAE